MSNPTTYPYTVTELCVVTEVDRDAYVTYKQDLDDDAQERKRFLSHFRRNFGRNRYPDIYFYRNVKAGFRFTRKRTCESLDIYTGESFDLPWLQIAKLAPPIPRSTLREHDTPASASKKEVVYKDSARREGKGTFARLMGAFRAPSGYFELSEQPKRHEHAHRHRRKPSMRHATHSQPSPPSETSEAYTVTKMWEIDGNVYVAYKETYGRGGGRETLRELKGDFATLQGMPPRPCPSAWVCAST